MKNGYVLKLKSGEDIYSEDINYINEKIKELNEFSNSIVIDTLYHLDLDSCVCLKQVSGDCL